MTISYSWLKDYLKCDLSAEQVAQALTSIGLEVDSVETVEQIPGGLKGVIVAHVVECGEHPDSDHLHVTKVDLGDCPEKAQNAAFLDENGLLQVVCGAPNVAAGQKVLLATIGTSLGEDFKIKKSKIRGIESFGMLCAEDELGIGSSHDGIMVLEADAVAGTPASKYLNLKTDTIIEIGLTANRVDAASHIGVARDLYAYLKLNNIPCELVMPQIMENIPESDGKAKGEISIVVEDPDGALRYSGITFENVKVGPSPAWMVERLQSIGLRSINNIVDITNFVLMEIGQPLHAFDADRIDGGKVIVRKAAQDEPIVTLDGVERKLDSRDLVIASASHPLCIAGVFGGQDSGTVESTSKVFLESAWFNAVSVRKTSKRHTLKTDASFRYERGTDPLVTEWAAARAAYLISELSGATLAGGIQKVYGRDVRKAQVELDYDRIESFIGKKIGTQTIENILTYLQYEFVEKTDRGAVVAVPSYMVDVYRECDVVEEILRIYGYNNIELPASIHSSVNPSEHPDPEAVRNNLSNFLAANGFNEIMNNSLTKGDYYSKLESFPAERCVKIMNPLSSDLNVMRQSLIPGALEVIAYNVNRQRTCMKLFEYGSVYRLREAGAEPDTLAKIEEHTEFCLVMTGSEEKSWDKTPSKGSFYALKGYVDLMLRRIGADVWNMECSNAPEDLFSEGICYSLPGGSSDVLVTMGTVRPAYAKAFGVKQPVFVAEISWPVLFKLVRRNKVKYSELPKFPEVRRDLALLLDESVPYSDIRKSVIRAGKKMVKSVSLFDVYRGDKIPSGKKQYAISFVLQDLEKTLTDNDTERIVNNILGLLQKEYGVQIR